MLDQDPLDSAPVGYLSDRKDRLMRDSQRPDFSLFLSDLKLFDFSQDIYEEIIEVTFFEKIRDQIKFHDQDELIKQMNEDYKYAIINIKKYGL